MVPSFNNWLFVVSRSFVVFVNAALDLFDEDLIAVLYEPDLRRRLDRDDAAEVEIVDLFVEPVEDLCKIIDGFTCELV
jgi:hypothetical protein